MALSKIQPASMDLTANYAFTGTNSLASVSVEEKKLTTVTADDSGTTLTISSNINNTYNIYKFRFIDLHFATNNIDFKVDYTTDGTNYNATQTSSMFAALHNESGSSTALEYRTGADVAQGTGPQIAENIGNGADESIAGELFLFDPSSTTFVKHWISKFHTYNQANYAGSHFASGYVNSTSAVTGVRFTSSSGNIQAGTIEMYGIN